MEHPDTQGDVVETMQGVADSLRIAPIGGFAASTHVIAPRPTAPAGA